MLLNCDEIKTAKILSNIDNNSFRSASYDLSVEKVIDMEANEQKDFVLKPQGMIVVIFKEEVTLPENILAFAHVKTSLARIGIMAINIGIIDPGYKGYISTVIINYGKKPYNFKIGSKLLRLTFHKFTPPNQSIPFTGNVPNDLYLASRQVDVLTYFGNTFLNLDSAKEEVKSSISEWIWKRITSVSMMIAAIALVVNLLNYYLNQTNKTEDSYIKTYNTQTRNVEEQYKVLETKMKQLEKQLNRKDTIN